ncbi:hypothetical protein TNCV_3502491 [Trichonephila clavipes]|uniref:Uncharacterized protein n=1 Tax=Trichonephila clavipes TaxID=2585209 RepID=A0A8X6S3U2_TRICX|nr:hypothetical protein TNCV_3502491 [Trichonephila clavipes]
MTLWEEYPRFRFARRDHGTVSYAVHGQLLLVFFFVKQDQNLVLRKSRLINGVAPDTVRNTLRVFRRDPLFSLEYKSIRDLRERRIPFGVWNRNVDDISVHSQPVKSLANPVISFRETKVSCGGGVMKVP